MTRQDEVSHLEEGDDDLWTKSQPYLATKSVLWERYRTAHKEKQQYEEEGRKHRKHLADTNFQLGCPSATDSEFYMGSAGKQSKWQKQELRAGNQDSIQAAELVGCAAVMKESFSKGLLCVGFSARSLMCSHYSLLLLLLFPLD